MKVPRLSEPFGGHEAAALFAAGVGVFALGAANLLGMWAVSAGVLTRASARPLLTLVALAVWVFVWGWCDRRWEGKSFATHLFMYVVGFLVSLGLVLASPLAYYVLRMPWP